MPIGPIARDLLNQLCSKRVRSKASVVKRVFALLEERLFWDEVRAAFASRELEETRVERKLWDATANDGLAGSRW